MFPAGVRHEAMAAEEGGSVMKRWQPGTGRSQETASLPPSSPTALSRTRSPIISSRAYSFSTSGSQNYLPITFDHTGQMAPPGAKIRLTTNLWEDEGTIYFQVETREVCVARREDNHMINGTKLLSAAGITRGRRDGILKSEKTRHVVKTGPMHLKGIWIPFERALALANKEKITELLYPLFVHDIKRLLYDPRNQKRTHLPKPQRKPQETKEWAEPTENHVRQIDVPEDGDKTSQEIPLDTLRNDELYERGPIGSLSRSLIETLGLILIEVRTRSDGALQYGSLESSCAALFFWDTDLGLSRGELDDMLQDSPQLRDTCLTVLVSISQFVSTSLIHLISSEQRRKEVLQSTRILTCLDQTANMIEQQCYSTYEPKQDAEALCQTLRTKIDTLIMPAPSLESPAEESFDDEAPRTIQHIEKHLPEQAYINSVSEKFPLAASAIVAQLGKLNWDRYNHMLRLQRETMQQELQMAAMEKARTIFNDSGLGASLPAQSKAASSPGSVCAPSIVSTRAETSHKRVPPLPAQARSGEPFTCEICNKQVNFQRTKAWKKHVFSDILAYACFFAECCNTRVFFEDSDALMTHLEDQHGMDVRISDVECPLCMEFTSGDRDVLALHIARHMEEIALAILPSGVESDEESACDSASDSISTDSYYTPRARRSEYPKDSTEPKSHSRYPGVQQQGPIVQPTAIITPPPPARPAKPAKPDRRTKARVTWPCVNCKKAHLCCDVQRPCGRCVASGKQETCKDVQLEAYRALRSRRRIPLTGTLNVQLSASIEDSDPENPSASSRRATSTPEHRPSPPSIPRGSLESQRPTHAISPEPGLWLGDGRQLQRNLNIINYGSWKATKGRSSDLDFTKDSRYLPIALEPPRYAPSKSRFFVPITSPSAPGSVPYDQGGYIPQLGAFELQLPPPSSSTPHRQPDIHGFGDQPTVPSSMIPQYSDIPHPYSASIPPGMYMTENSSYGTWSKVIPRDIELPPPPTSPSTLPGSGLPPPEKQNFLSVLSNLALPEYKLPDPGPQDTPHLNDGKLESDPQGNIETSSIQQWRPRLAPHIATKRPTYAEVTRMTWEQARQRESERQNNSGASSKQRSESPWEYKGDRASKTTPKSSTEYRK